MEDKTPIPSASENSGTAPEKAPAAPEKAAAAPPKKRHRTLRALGFFLLKLAIVAGVVWAVLTYVLSVAVVHTNDMYPAVRDGDLVITYRLRAPARGDIVGYVAGGVHRFGRIVGLEGDVIEMDAEGHYTVNGGVPYETIYYETRRDPDSGISYPYTVPAGTVFVLNDLRENTGDSRRFGAIPVSDTDGSAALLLRRRSW